MAVGLGMSVLINGISVSENSYDLRELILDVLPVPVVPMVELVEGAVVLRGCVEALLLSAVGRVSSFILLPSLIDVEAKAVDVLRRDVAFFGGQTPDRKGLDEELSVPGTMALDVPELVGALDTEVILIGTDIVR